MMYKVRYGWQSVYPSLANLSGHPATAFPVGLTRSGLPIGLQAIGPYLEDRTPIRFAALVAREFGGFCKAGSRRRFPSGRYFYSETERRTP
jgi:amidase